MENYNQNKIRSISFDGEVNNYLEKVVKEEKSNYSSMLNRILRYTIALNQNIKNELATFAFTKYVELQNQIDKETGLRKVELEKERDEYLSLIDIFTSGKESKALNVSNFKRINIKNNSYLICPEEWEYVEGIGEETSSTNAYVIEFYNSKKFKLPHYVFITDHASIDEDFQRKVLDKIADINDDYANIRREHPDPRLDLDSLPHPDIIKESPMSGFFKIPVLGSSNEYMMGAMIIEQN